MRRSRSDVSVATWLIPVVTGTKPPCCALSASHGRQMPTERPANGANRWRSAFVLAKLTAMVVTAEQLAAGLTHVRAAPAEQGVVDLVVRRPGLGRREILDAGELDTVVGLIGDTWSVRPSRHTPDRSPHPEMQLNLMNARMTALVAGSEPAD